MEERFVASVRHAGPAEPLDEGWRRVDLSIDSGEGRLGSQCFSTYCWNGMAPSERSNQDPLSIEGRRGLVERCKTRGSRGTPQATLQQRDNRHPRG